MAKSRSRTPLRRRLVPLYERLRHPEAHLTGRRPAPSNSVIYLMYAKYLLLESERVDGTLVGTPMWFAMVDDTIFVRAEAESPEIERIRQRPVVKVASCTTRGVPTGDYIECVARVVPREQEAHADAALRRSYGTLRRLRNTLARNDYVDLELAPLDLTHRRVPEDEALASGLRLVHEDRKTPPDAA
jgi:PPOX class probable F420-dependent enzyme